MIGEAGADASVEENRHSALLGGGIKREILIRVIEITRALNLKTPKSGAVPGVDVSGGVLAEVAEGNRDDGAGMFLGSGHHLIVMVLPPADAATIEAESLHAGFAALFEHLLEEAVGLLVMAVIVYDAKVWHVRHLRRRVRGSAVSFLRERRVLPCRGRGLEG